MANWKKVVVSGSSAELNSLNVDGTIDASILTVDEGSGSFSGSFQGNGSGLTSVVLDNALVDGSGINDFSYDGSAGATVSVQVSGSTLTVGTDGVAVNAGGITNAEIATDAVNSDSIAAGAVDTAELAAGAVTNAKIAADSIEVSQLSGSAVVTAAEGIGSNDVDTAVPTAAAVKAYADSVVGAADLDISGSSGGGNIDLDSQIFTVTGESGVISTVASGQTITVNVDAGGITNAKLDNDGLMIGNTDISLGATGSTIDGVTLTDVEGSGSFSGSFFGDGSGLTGVPASGIVLSELSDGNGIVDFSYNGQSAATIAVEADGDTLTVGANGVKVSDSGITETQLSSSVAGTGLSGGDGTALSVDYGSTAGTAAEGNSTVTFTGTANEVTVSDATAQAIGGNVAVTIGLPDDVTIGQDLTVTRDASVGRDLTVTRNLTVLGTASFQNTEDLDVADRFIRLASGSNANGDGGIVIQQDSAANGEAFAWDTQQGRWGVTSSFDASTNTITPDAFMALAYVGTTADPTDAPNRYQKAGNIFVGSDGEAYIYT